MTKAARGRAHSSTGTGKKGLAVWSVITRSLISDSGKFLPQEAGAALIAKCKVAESGPYCETAYSPEDAIEVLKEYDEAMATLQDYAEYSDNRELLTLAYELRQGLRQAALAAMGQMSRHEAGRMREGYHSTDHEEAPAFIDSNEVDAIDITGLEGGEARRLALLLKRWNSNAKRVFVRRKGLRYLSPSVRRININHPFIREMSFHNDLLVLIKERNIPLTHE